MNSRDPVPVTLVTGFLGAGKTTLLNHLLASDHGARLGVILNEFDPLGIDRDLIVGTEGQLVEMTNGCLCCTVQGDLKGAVRELLEAGRHLEGLVIETTGLANPGPIATAFFADPYLCDATRLDAILTVVDAANVRRHLPANDPHGADHADDGVARAQISHADLLILNKTDLVAPAELERVAAELRGINPLARLVTSAYGVVPVDQLLGLGAFELDQRFCAPGAEVPHAHGHDPAIGSVSFRFTRAFDAIRLNQFFCDLLRRYPETLYRCKGIVEVAGQEEPLVFQGVSALFATSVGLPWKSTGQRESRLVFIGKELDGAWIARTIEGCLNPIT